MEAEWDKGLEAEREKSWKADKDKGIADAMKKGEWSLRGEKTSAEVDRVKRL
jgi:hypothetical protein